MEKAMFGVCRLLDANADPSTPPWTALEQLPRADEAILELEQLPAVDEAILEAASAKRVTIKKLAALAGYAYTQWFRERVNSLIEAGKLSRTSQGVCRDIRQWRCSCH
jgi:hypothetical protein